jgi:hypothetical protein
MGKQFIDGNLVVRSLRERNQALLDRKKPSKWDIYMTQEMWFHVLTLYITMSDPVFTLRNSDRLIDRISHLYAMRYGMTAVQHGGHGETADQKVSDFRLINNWLTKRMYVCGKPALPNARQGSIISTYVSGNEDAAFGGFVRGRCMIMFDQQFGVYHGYGDRSESVRDALNLGIHAVHYGNTPTIDEVVAGERFGATVRYLDHYQAAYYGVVVLPDTTEIVSNNDRWKSAVHTKGSNGKSYNCEDPTLSDNYIRLAANARSRVSALVTDANTIIGNPTVYPSPYSMYNRVIYYPSCERRVISAFPTSGKSHAVKLLNAKRSGYAVDMDEVLREVDPHIWDIKPWRHLEIESNYKRLELMFDRVMVWLQNNNWTVLFNNFLNETWLDRLSHYDHTVYYVPKDVFVERARRRGDSEEFITLAVEKGWIDDWSKQEGAVSLGDRYLSDIVNMDIELKPVPDSWHKRSSEMDDALAKAYLEYDVIRGDFLDLEDNDSACALFSISNSFNKSPEESIRRMMANNRHFLAMYPNINTAKVWPPGMLSKWFWKDFYTFRIVWDDDTHVDYRIEKGCLIKPQFDGHILIIDAMRLQSINLFGHRVHKNGTIINDADLGWPTSGKAKLAVYSDGDEMLSPFIVTAQGVFARHKVKYLDYCADPSLVLDVGLTSWTCRDVITLSYFDERANPKPFNPYFDKRFDMNHPLMNLWMFVERDVLNVVRFAQGMINSQTYTARVLTVRIRDLYGLNDDTLQSIRRWALVSLWPGRHTVPYIDRRISGVIFADGKRRTVAVAGHMVNILLSSILGWPDMPRYMDTIEGNVQAYSEAGTVRDYINEAAESGFLAEGNWKLSGRLWHSYYDFYGAVAAYIQLARLIGIKIHVRNVVYTVRRLKQIRAKYPKFLDDGWQATDFIKDLRTGKISKPRVGLI